jgi:hypothetical protein
MRETTPFIIGVCGLYGNRTVHGFQIGIKGADGRAISVAWEKSAFSGARRLQ